MEYSGGCESGWTMYLDQSAEELASIGLAAKGGYHQEVVEEEEDLSMVSDASSGPAMFHNDEDEEEENYCIGNLCSRPVSIAALTWKNDNRMRIQRKGLEKHDSLVDDTASSHALGCSKVCKDKSKSSSVQYDDYHCIVHNICSCILCPSTE